MDQRTDIRKHTSENLEKFFLENGEKGFLVNQVYEWLWKKSAKSFDEMSNISLKTRELLKNHFIINPFEVDQKQYSKDKTIKSTFKLYDGNIVEGVLIPTDKRMTACISSQVGCSLSCKFCATGYMKQQRNLDAAEIYDQVVYLNRQSKEEYSSPLTNIVYMGMGEPLLNYASVLKSIEYLTSKKGLGISSKRITVSTAGIAKMIKKLGDDKVKFNLALSLHAANDTKRNSIMPINESNSLKSLAEALSYYYKKTNNLITFEYIIFDKFNDSIGDAEELVKFARRVPSKINIIEYNSISEANFHNANPDALEKFNDYLLKKGMNVRVRRSRGKDIDAACGQLANKN